MNAKQLLASFSLICGLHAFAIEQNADALLSVYPKNLARQHLGTNLFLFSASTKTYVPTQAAAAWLDDDIATGWPSEPGKQFYLLSLKEPKLLRNLSASFKGAAGTVSFYAGDEASAPESKSWTLLAKDVPVEFVNDQLLAKPFARYAKYLLVETNLSNPGVWYSLFLYGETPAVSYDLRKREQAVDTHAMIGPFVNDESTINLGGLYAKSRVIHGGESFLALQKAIDDNPETSTVLGGAYGAMFLKFEKLQSVRRVSVLAAKPLKGKLEFFILAQKPEQPTTAQKNGSEYMRVAYEEPQSTTSGRSTPLDGVQPNGSLSFDGVNARYSLEFEPVSGEFLAVRWIPDTAGESLSLAELDVFSGPVTLADYELSHPQEVAKIRTRDGKSFKTSYKSAKELLPSVGEYLPQSDQATTTSTSFPSTPVPPSSPPSDPPLPPTTNPTPTPTPTPSPRVISP